MVYAAQRLDGTATGEHGVGLGKVEVRPRLSRAASPSRS
jgi:hypothetical protein